MTQAMVGHMLADTCRTAPFRDAVVVLAWQCWKHLVLDTRRDDQGILPWFHGVLVERLYHLQAHPSVQIHGDELSQMPQSSLQYGY